MENQEIYNIAEQYLRGELTEEERQRVDDRLKTDPSFAAVFAKYLLAKRTIKEAARKEWKQELMDKAAKKSAKDAVVKPLSRQRYLGWMAAAAVFLFAFAAFWLWNRPAPKSLFAAESTSIYQNEIYALDTRTAQSNFRTLFENGAYKAALAEAKNQYAQAEEMSRWQWQERQGFCHWQLQEWEKAMSVFQELEKNDLLLSAKNPARWYQALTYLGKEDYGACRQLLQDIVALPDYLHRGEAVELLGKIEGL